jgi:hypothetical protein
MPRKPALDKYREVLFDNFDENKHLTSAERMQLKCYRFCFNEYLENPAVQDKSPMRLILAKDSGFLFTS